MVSVHHLAVNGIGLSQKLIGFFDIAKIQLLTDIGAADIPVIILFFFNDNGLKSILRPEVSKKLCISGTLIAKAAVGSGHNRLRMHLLYQHLCHKILRGHGCHFSVKRILDQIIHAHSPHVIAPFLVGGNDRCPLPGHNTHGCHIKGKDCCLPSVIFLLTQHFF